MRNYRPAVRIALAGFFAFSCSPAAPPRAPQSTAPEPSAAAAAHEHSHGMHKDFSDAKGFSKSFDDPERDAWQRPAEVIEHMKIAPGSVVADLGTGTGYFLGWLSRAVGPSGKVLALDVESEMIRFVTERAEQQRLTNVEPRQVAADDPGLAAGSVARVLIVDTWHHIDDRPQYARKLAAALGPGGEVWIVDFTADSDIGPPARYRVSPEQAVSELAGGGLKAEIVQGETLPKQYIVRGVRP
jgi:ubiquinone/menaquinone biosynthesis C-methylase UbiE